MLHQHLQPAGTAPAGLPSLVLPAEIRAAIEAGAWIVFQGVEVMAEPWGLSPGLQRSIHLLVAVGFLVALVLAWYHGEQGRQRVSGPELLRNALPWMNSRSNSVVESPSSTSEGSRLR